MLQGIAEYIDIRKKAFVSNDLLVVFGWTCSCDMLRVNFKDADIRFAGSASPARTRIHAY